MYTEKNGAKTAPPLELFHALETWFNTVMHDSDSGIGIDSGISHISAGIGIGIGINKIKLGWNRNRNRNQGLRPWNRNRNQKFSKTFQL